MDAAQDHLDDVVAAIAYLRSCLARNPGCADMEHSLEYLLRMEAAWHEKYTLSTSVAPSNDDSLTLWFSQWITCWKIYRQTHDWRRKPVALVIPMPQDVTPPFTGEKTRRTRYAQHTLVRGRVILLLLLLATLLALGHAGHRHGQGPDARRPRGGAGPINASIPMHNSHKFAAPALP